MQTTWEGKNVDLELLIEQLGDFFKERKFEAIRGKKSTGYEILADGSPLFQIQGYISATVDGKPGNFTVTMELCGGRKRHFEHSPFLLSMFGGGYLLLKDLKSDEAWLKLQKEFKSYLTNSVLQLANTAMSSDTPKE